MSCIEVAPYVLSKYLYILNETLCIRAKTGVCCACCALFSCFWKDTLSHKPCYALNWTGKAGCNNVCFLNFIQKCAFTNAVKFED